MDRSKINGSPTSKYRITLSMPNLHSPTSLPVSDASSPPRLSTPNVATILRMMKKTPSGSKMTTKTDLSIRDTVLKVSDEIGPAVGNNIFIGSQPKLPNKFRQQVSRLRNQFAQAGSSDINRNINKNHTEGGSQISTTSNALRSSITSSTKPTSVHQSNSKQPLFTHAPFQKKISGNGETSNVNSFSSSAKDFMTLLEILRPLQNSLSCTSLISEWTSDDEEDEYAEQLFRQSERENSRMLRICCSIDNLLLSIGDHMQEEKHNNAIVRGSARELVRLFQFAIKQAAAVPMERSVSACSTANNNTNYHSNTEQDKEAQYAQEFLIEIADRIVTLADFVHSTFTQEINGLQEQITTLEYECSAMKEANNRLQTEMTDLREFHAQSIDSTMSLNSVNFKMEVASSSSEPAVDEDSEAKQRRKLSLFPATVQTVTPNKVESVEDELKFLQQQCDEYTRLLEMAKEEIQLSHRECERHKIRLAEVTNAMFKDNEMALLRNHLQSEKKRVKILEMENLALRECQTDQMLKVQSLLLNGSVPTNGPSGGLKLNETRSDISAATELPHHNGLSRGSSESGTLIVPSTSSSLYETRRSQLELLNVEKRDSSSSDINDHAPTEGSISVVVSRDEDLSTSNSADANHDYLYRKRKGVGWFYHVIGMSQLQTKHHDRNLEQYRESLKNFILGVMMSDSDLKAAHDQAGVRRQANVPAITPPPSRSSKQSQIRAIKNSKDKAASTIKPNCKDDLQDILHGCQQLIWFFYQRFLMAEEAQKLLPKNHTTCQVSASLGNVVLHFFMERKSTDKEAIQDAFEFVNCIHLVRDLGYDVALFCEFLEGVRTRDALCFYLWVLQAIADTKLGISYDIPIENDSKVTDLQFTPYICMLKATFLTRIIFRVMRFKGNKTPLSAPHRQARSKSTVKVRNRSDTTATPLLSPKRRQKSRLQDIPASPTRLTSVFNSVKTNQESNSNENKALLDRAKSSFYIATQQNNGSPLSLEQFNGLMMQFAVTPSAEELLARLGPFYQPTGEERKVPSYVFLLLIMEMYSYQVQWEKTQMQLLFAHLSQLHQMEERKHVQTTGLLNVDNFDMKNGKKNRDAKSAKKIKKVSKKKRDDVSLTDKYSKGLTRKLLADFLIQAGIVSDVLQINMDALYVLILETTNRSGSEIPFDEIYGVLEQLKWLNNPDFQIDATTTLLGQHDTTESNPEDAITLEKVWHVYAKESLAMCENDPNIFVRSQSHVQLRTMDQQFRRLASASPSVSHRQLWHLMQNLRDFIEFSWRVAAKRASGNQLRAASEARQYLIFSETFFTELFYANQVIRTVIDTADYGLNRASHEYGATTMLEKDELHSFYDTKQMHIDDILDRFASHDWKTTTKALRPPEQDHNDGKSHLRLQLEHVLQRFALHFAHLFHSFTIARFNFAGMSKYEWKMMVEELGVVSKHLPFTKLDEIFHCVDVSGNASSSTENRKCGDVWIDKTQFVESLIRIAFTDHFVLRIKKRKRVVLGDAPLRPAHIMALFCQEIVVPKAFHHRNRLQEGDFTQKLSCPLVCRALLEHRAFLRSVFFYYAELDEIQADKTDAQHESPSPSVQQEHNILSIVHGFQLEKTKRKSMNFDEFRKILQDCGLLRDEHTQCSTTSAAKAVCDVATARQIFRSVMKMEYNDVSQMEFDEFASAIVALAVLRTPDPFTLWHEKIDQFVMELQNQVAKGNLHVHH